MRRNMVGAILTLPLFFAAMLEEGVYLAPSPYEAGFVSLSHRPREIAETLDSARRALARVARMR